MSERPENVAFQSLELARVRDGAEWPEPETSEFYRVLARGASNIVVAVLGHRDPDLAREIAARALLHIRNFRGTSQFSTWFYRIARNEAIRKVTQDAPREEQFEVGADYAGQDNVPLSLPRQLTKAEKGLLKAVLRGDSFEVIGSVLGASKMSVSRRWAKLRTKLGEMYGRRNKP